MYDTDSGDFGSDGPVSAPVQPDSAELFQDRVRRLAAELSRIGVGSRQIQRLFSRYDIDVIEQQILWLPFRRARKPASVIVMAIIENYEKPSRLD